VVGTVEEKLPAAVAPVADVFEHEFVLVDEKDYSFGQDGRVEQVMMHGLLYCDDSKSWERTVVHLSLEEIESWKR